MQSSAQSSYTIMNIEDIDTAEAKHTFIALIAHSVQSLSIAENGIPAPFDDIHHQYIGTQTQPDKTSFSFYTH